MTEDRPRSDVKRSSGPNRIRTTALQDPLHYVGGFDRNMNQSPTTGADIFADSICRKDSTVKTK